MSHWHPADDAHRSRKSRKALLASDPLRILHEGVNAYSALWYPRDEPGPDPAPGTVEAACRIAGWLDIPIVRRRYPNARMPDRVVDNYSHFGVREVRKREACEMARGKLEVEE